jgi:predicted nicotinamide N-methyase
VPAADVVTAGDVFYNRDLAERMLAFLTRAAEGGALVLVGDPGRAYVPERHLRAVAAYDVPTTHDLESADFKRATVWKLANKIARMAP